METWNVFKVRIPGYAISSFSEYHYNLYILWRCIIRGFLDFKVLCNSGCLFGETCFCTKTKTEPHCNVKFTRYKTGWLGLYQNVALCNYHFNLFLFCWPWKTMIQWVFFKGKLTKNCAAIFYIAYLSDRKKRKGRLWLLGQTKYSLMKNLDGEMMVSKSCVVLNFFSLVYLEPLMLRAVKLISLKRWLHLASSPEEIK